MAILDGTEKIVDEWLGIAGAPGRIAGFLPDGRGCLRISKHPGLDRPSVLSIGFRRRWLLWSNSHDLELAPELAARGPVDPPDELDGRDLVKPFFGAIDLRHASC